MVAGKVSYRLERIAETLMRELAAVIQNDIQDPRVKDVTLSAVKISPDLRHAKVYFTALDEKQVDTLTRALNHTVPYLRRRIAQNMQLRVVPNLFFTFDKALRHAEHLTQLINTVVASDEQLHSQADEENK